MLAVAALLFWWAHEDEEPVVAPTPPPPAVPTEPSAVVVPVPDAAVAFVVQVPDAAITLAPQTVDAGPGEQLRIDEIMQRWRAALTPLFRYDRKLAFKPPALIAVSSEGKEPPPPEPRCEDRETHYPLHATGTVDFVIAIDTSGSMGWVLSEVVRWLGSLELALREKGANFNLIVVADHRSLYRKKVARDAGAIQADIGSTDAMETLIRSAREGAGPRWTQLLRPGSVKHLVVVTDDEANDKRGLPYLGPLVEAANGMLGTEDAPAFTFHLVGGFAPPNPQEVLPAQAPLVTQTCPEGQAPGLAYQRLAQVTGGTRTSLCYPSSFRAAARALVEWPVVDLTTSCVWLMRPGSVVVSAWAERARGTSARLWEVHTASSCYGRKDSFLASGQVFALCESTCVGLSDAGFENINVLVRCEPERAAQ